MTGNIKIDFDVNKLKRKLKVTDEQITDLGKMILIALADRLVELIQERAPKDSGKYSEGWKREKPEKNKIRITNPDGLLYNILEFTGRKKLHIEPNKKKVLHFVINGEDIFVMWSNPGATQPEPHVRPALKQLGKEGKQIILPLIKKKFPIYK